MIVHGVVCQGLGVVCNKEGGFGEDDFVVEFLGEVWMLFCALFSILLLLQKEILFA